MRYRRAKTPGGSYFFTVVTFRRRKFLCEPGNVELLRTAFRTVKSAHPFTIGALCVVAGTPTLRLDIAVGRPPELPDALDRMPL